MSSSVPPSFRPRRFDLVVFDWDGTLFDSTALIVQSIQAACRDLGTAVPDDARAAWVIGLSLRAALTHAAPDLAPEQYPLLADRYRHHYLARQHALSLFPGVLELLRAADRALLLTCFEKKFTMASSASCGAMVSRGRPLQRDAKPGPESNTETSSICASRESERGRGNLRAQLASGSKLPTMSANVSGSIACRRAWMPRSDRRS